MVIAAAGAAAAGVATMVSMVGGGIRGRSKPDQANEQEQPVQADRSSAPSTG